MTMPVYIYVWDFQVKKHISDERYTEIIALEGRFLTGLPFRTMGQNSKFLVKNEIFVKSLHT